MIYNNMLMRLFNQVRTPYQMPVEPPQMNGMPFQPMPFEGGMAQPYKQFNPMPFEGGFGFGGGKPSVQNIGTNVPNMGTNALAGGNFRRPGMMGIRQRY